MGWLFEENLAWLVVAAVLGAVVTVGLALVRVRTAEPARPQAAEDETVVEPEPAPEPEPEPEPAPEPEVLVDGGPAGAAEPLADGSAPSQHFSIKGNKGSMKYHTAASPYYRRVRADWWFDSEDAARSAGFRRWDEKPPADDAPAAPPLPAEDATPFEAPDPTRPTDPVHPYGDGSAAPLEGGRAPGPEFTVKASSRSRTFHTPESPWFARIRAEVWFDSEESARAAGFARWDD